MSKETKSSKSKNARNQNKPLFSEKENAIIGEELSDRDSYKRNLPVLLDLLRNDPHLDGLRINPFQIMHVVESRHRSVTANASIGGQSMEDERFIDMIVQDFAEQVNPQLILEVLIPVAKAAKIKREKRVLLWAAAEILATLGSKKSLRESAAIRVVVLSSVQHSMILSNQASSFVRELKPFTFSYKKILDDTFSVEEWVKLLEQVEPVEPDFTFAMSQQAMYFFEKLSRPFGWRFHRIIRYPEAVKNKPKRSILMPGENQAQQENEPIDEETSRRLAECLMKDYSPSRRLEFAKDALQSIKSAGFGEMEETQLNACLNAAAYCFLSTLPICPFLAALYQASGEKADRINPSDERELVIDLKGSADNTRLHQRYAELLENKKEYRGAAQVYSRLQEISEERDPEIEKKIEELLKIAQDQRTTPPEQVSTIAAAAETAMEENKPTSNLIITP